MSRKTSYKEINILREIMHAFNLTIEDAADILGVSKVSIYKYFNGTGGIRCGIKQRIHNLNDACCKLGLSKEQLFDINWAGNLLTLPSADARLEDIELATQRLEAAREAFVTKTAPVVTPTKVPAVAKQMRVKLMHTNGRMEENIFPLTTMNVELSYGHDLVNLTRIDIETFEAPTEDPHTDIFAEEKTEVAPITEADTVT
jgi:transcriptional regulator with XRE-family HTH domain